MSESLLDPAELEAIQAAIRESTPRGSSRSSQADVEATRLPLLSDDRIAEAGRPILINLATRWVRPLTRALKPYVPGNWQLDPIGAEIIDGTIAREELRGGWVGGLTGGVGDLVIAANGSFIDVAAAKRCGATDGAADPNRDPSAVSLRLFHPVGKALLESWNVAWREVFTGDLTPTTDPKLAAALIEARTVLRIALMFSGDVAGRVQIYARPETLVHKPAALAAHKATASLIANALGLVPVEVVAELGTLRLRLNEIRKLAPGSTYKLTGFVDARVPIYCAGVLKAWARPVVYRGVIGLQVESVVHDQGTKQ